MTATLTPINAPDGANASGGYAQSLLASGAERLLFVSGQIPEDRAGHVPETFDTQAEQVWRNVLAQLRAADMAVSDIVKVTTFLSDRAYRDANSRIRQEVLGDHTPALTVIICDIYDEAWLLEIEVVAAQ
jgi:enamine deaminase RidA (YjgF/YER057c/UK114 family)